MELKCAHQRFGASLHMEICFRFVPEKAECSVAPDAGSSTHHSAITGRWLIHIEKFHAPWWSVIGAGITELAILLAYESGLFGGTEEMDATNIQIYE